MSTFEQGLWERLVTECHADRVVLGARTRNRRRAPILAASATALGATTVAAVLLLSATTATPPAYALTRNADGSVTVTINDIATAVPQLNAKFRQMGIDETVIPVQSGCPTPGLVNYPGATTTESLTFYPNHAYLAPGYDGVLAAEQLSNGEVALTIGAMTPPLPSCFSNIPIGGTPGAIRRDR